MSNRSGRPAKGSEQNSKEKIINEAVSIIRRKGADAVTVRDVCESAGLSIGTFYHYFRDKDDLMMHFLRETSFDSYEFLTPLSDIAGRITELYMHLIGKYMDLGLDFMKSFYSTSNQSLSAYMGEVNGAFASGTVMARSEAEMRNALSAGFIKADTDIHTVCMDICTIVKGCVFEWCLNDGRPDIESILHRILENYLRSFQ
jgi:AcrR family transcriptional regulator